MIAQLADKLIAAEHPILICGYAGQSKNAPKLIEELATFAGIAVFEGNYTFNISHEFPCFLGYSPNKHLPKADVGLLVDVDVPWFPADVSHNEKSFWAHIDVDTLKSASPMWTFPGNLRMQGDSGVILGQLLEALKAKATPKFKEAAQKRVAALTAERAAWRESVAKMAANKGKPDEINPHYLFAELNKHLKPDDMVFNEGVRNAGACAMQLTRPLPNTCVRSGGGGLGWSGGMALGAKLAAPDKMAVQVVGDGGFYFGGPSSVFSVAQQYKLPILVRAARQHRLVGGEGIDAARVPARRGQVVRQVPGGPDAGRRLLQDRRGVRRPWREGRQSGRRARSAGALREGGARRPRGAPARAGDEALGFRSQKSRPRVRDARPVSFQQKWMAPVAGNRNLNVMVSVAFRGLFEQFEPEYRQTTGFGFAPVYAPAGTVVKRVRAGEKADVLVITPETMKLHDRRRAGRSAGSEHNIAKSVVGVAVRAGAPKPKIATADDVRAALLAAKAVAYTDPSTGAASGVHFVQIAERLGIPTR